MRTYVLQIQKKIFIQIRLDYPDENASDLFHCVRASYVCVCVCVICEFSNLVLHCVRLSKRVQTGYCQIHWQKNKSPFGHDVCINNKRAPQGVATSAESTHTHTEHKSSVLCVNRQHRTALVLYENTWDYRVNRSSAHQTGVFVSRMASCATSRVHQVWAAVSCLLCATPGFDQQSETCGNLRSFTTRMVFEPIYKTWANSCWTREAAAM